VSSLQIVLNDIETQVPLHLRPVRRMSDDELFDFCVANPSLRIERTAEGEILVMAPTGLETANRNMDLSAQLQRWAKRDGRGKAFDSNAEFILPDGAALSPDASWVLNSRLNALTREQKRKFPPLCPDFVVELTSPADRLPQVKKKMAEWMKNGAQLGWLIDADHKTVYIFRPDQPPEQLVAPSNISGEGPVAGFKLELDDIFAGL
jgi:Uma2 family endonuclease